MAPRLNVRRGTPVDAEIVARLFFALWPDGTLAEHREEAASILGLGSAKGIARPSRRRPSVPKGKGFGQFSDTGTAVLFGHPAG